MPDPKKYKTKKAFMAACVPIVMDEDGTDDNDHAVAKCLGMWKNRTDEGLEMKKETRIIPLTEMRVTKKNDEDPIIEGYAALFNNWSEDLGGFRERIKPGAFKNAINKSDTRALFNHDSNYVLGRRANKTLTLEENSVGLRMRIVPPDTQWARDLMLSINRGDIDQSSFGFVVKEDEWKEDKEGRITRTITEFDELFDVSVVTFPAYPDTKVALRQLEEFRGSKTIDTDDNKTIIPGSENADPEHDKVVAIHKTSIMKKRLALKTKIINLEA